MRLGLQAKILDPQQKVLTIVFSAKVRVSLARLSLQETRVNVRNKPVACQRRIRPARLSLLSGFVTSREETSTAQAQIYILTT